MHGKITQGWLAAGTKDEQSVTPDWQRIDRPSISGVVVKEIGHVVTRDGHLTELIRSEWLGDNRTIDQVFQRTLDPGAISGWHAHVRTTDRLFCLSGRLLIVLCDGRIGSATAAAVGEQVVSALRPTLIVVPPGVWHAVKNIGSESAILLNMVDIAYEYEDPDHWRLPLDSDKIPYRF